MLRKEIFGLKKREHSNMDVLRKEVDNMLSIGCKPESGRLSVDFTGAYEEDAFLKSL